MSEDEFDLSAMKKKSKKKKKKVDFEFDDDAAAGTETDQVAQPGADDDGAAAPAAATSAAPAAAAEEKDKDKDDDINFDDDLDFGGKKKKKKKPVVTEDDGAAEEPKKEKKAAEAPEGDDLDIDLDEDFSTKKKKKKKKPAAGEASEGATDAPATTTTTQQPQQPDREYAYQELLERVFDIMRQRNPDMVAGEKKRFVMKPPQVVRIGAKKTSFVNFPDICKTLRRLPDHLLGFILAELGTSGSVDGSNALVIKGRFTQKQLESVLKRYIREYVTCHTCKSPDSILRKENRLFFLLCETCGSKCSVASIKSGFQAVTGRRAAMRANAPN